MGDTPHQQYDVDSFNETFSHPSREVRLRIGEVEIPETNGFYAECARRSSEDSLR